MEVNYPKQLLTDKNNLETNIYMAHVVDIV